MSKPGPLVGQQRWVSCAGGGAGVTEEERCGERLQIRPLILRLSSFCCERPQPAPPDKRNEPQTPQFRHLLEGKLGPDDVLPACPSPRAPHSVQAHTCPGLWVVVVAGVEVGQRRGRFLDQLFSSEHTFALQSAAAPAAVPWTHIWHPWERNSPNLSHKPRLQAAASSRQLTPAFPHKRKGSFCLGWYLLPK